MSSPFSDTSSPSTQLPDVWEQAAKLAERLGLGRNVAGWRTGALPADQMRLMLVAMNTVLDRLDALEAKPAQMQQAQLQAQAGLEAATAEHDESNG